MKQRSGIRIELTCRHETWWRYNVEMMCAAFDAAENRIGFSSARSKIAEAGAELREPPAGVAVPASLTLDAAPCDHALLFVYIIPHSLPADNRIEAAEPCEIELRIAAPGLPLRRERFRVNPWGGASIRLRIDGGRQPRE